GANGIGLAQPVMSNDDGGLAVWPLHAVTVDPAVNVPHDCGFASTARGPLKNVSVRLSNGSCGRSSNTVVRWPVLGSGVTLPPSWSSVPGPESTMKIRNGLLAVGAPKYSEPVSGLGWSGLVIETLPIFGASGHVAGSSDVAPSCASEQRASPSAAGGASATPSGSVTCTRRSAGVPSSSGSLFCGSVVVTE